MDTNIYHSSTTKPYDRLNLRKIRHHLIPLIRTQACIPYRSTRSLLFNYITLIIALSSSLLDRPYHTRACAPLDQYILNRPSIRSIPFDILRYWYIVLFPKRTKRGRSARLQRSIRYICKPSAKRNHGGLGAGPQK
jgi:hypothetical protein